MTDTTLVRPADRELAMLLSLEDEDALEIALAASEPGLAARAVCAAPTLEHKTTLLWAMEDRQRREVLQRVPPALVGALVQNLEEDNRYLLGDLSLEQFRALLSLCSPERKYYWITTSLSFTDARANLLPLLIPTRELAEILLTKAEFEEHLRMLAEYPLHEQRIPPEMMNDPAQALVDYFSAEQMLTQFPVAEPALAHVLQTLLDYDPDRYVDLIRIGLRQINYAENRPLEWQALTEDPVLLDELPAVEPLPELTLEDMPLDEGPPLALVPVAGSPLARVAAGLPPAQVQRVAGEMQYLYVRQAIAEGGSFLQSDLQRVARSVEAYLLLGLRAESGGRPEREAEVLGARPLYKITHSGAKLVEGLRQIAIRLGPLEKVLSAEQRGLVRSLSSPKLTVSATGEPVIRLLPAGNLPDEVDFATASALLHEVAAWSAVARALGLQKTEQSLARGLTVAQLLEELTLAAVLFGRIDLGLAEPADRRRFEQRYVAGVEQPPRPEARAGLLRALESWCAEHRVELSLALPLFEAALGRLALEPGG